MSYLVAISCARDEREHAEMLKAFLLEELGESTPGINGASGTPSVYFYVDEPQTSPSAVQKLKELYDDSALMVAIVGDEYGQRSVPAWEGQILSKKASAGEALVALIDETDWPPGLDVALRGLFPIPDRLPKEPLNSRGFQLLRDFARKVLAALAAAGKKPEHPRETRGPIDRTTPAIRRHLHGLEYVFNGASATIGKEAHEAVKSSAVLLGRLEQAQRAAAVAAALVDLGAIAADEGKADTSSDSLGVHGSRFMKLQGAATKLVRELATAAEKRMVQHSFPLWLRVRLLLRLEHYLTKHTIEDAPLELSTDTTPLSLLMEPLQDIVLPNPARRSIILSKQACPVLQEKAARVAESLSLCHWSCAGKLSCVEAPRGLDELQRFRAASERHLQTQPRTL
jgi:hypothetical protein